MRVRVENTRAYQQIVQHSLASSIERPHKMCLVVERSPSDAGACLHGGQRAAGGPATVDLFTATAAAAAAAEPQPLTCKRGCTA